MLQSHWIHNLHSASFSHDISDFNIIETHISWVILAGHNAYKIKKPLQFPFLDYSTQHLRQHFCQAELDLNLKFSNDIYLGLITIRGDVSKPIFSNDEADGPILDHAIHMRRFKQDELLCAQLQKKQVSAEKMQRLAEVIAEFHLSTDEATLESVFGTPEQTHQFTMDNYDECCQLLQTKEPHLVTQLQQEKQNVQQYFESLYDVFKTRKMQRYIRSCHGDLYANNIVEINGKPIPFDRIEFNEPFRLIDTVADYSFLLMDLEANGHFHEATVFLNRYLEITGDHDGVLLLNYYKSYRAMVRAKIALYTASQIEDVELQKRERQKFKDYFELSKSYFRSPKTTLTLMHGLSGSGKSTHAKQLALETGAIVIRADIERKRLLGKPALDRPSPHEKGIWYSQAHTQKTFARLFEITQTLLKNGYSVIVDAAFLTRQTREPFIELGKQQPQFQIILCEADDATLQQRLETRHAHCADPSDADFEVVLFQKQINEAFAEDELIYVQKRP